MISKSLPYYLDRLKHLQRWQVAKLSVVVAMAFSAFNPEMKNPFHAMYVSVTKNNIKLVNLIKRHLMNDCLASGAFYAS